jgi:hypothetical protein
MPIKAVFRFLDVKPQIPISTPITPLMIVQLVINEPMTHQIPNTNAPIAPPLAAIFSRLPAIGGGCAKAIPTGWISVPKSV